jgi:hypothetical protein
MMSEVGRLSVPYVSDVLLGLLAHLLSLHSRRGSA